MSNKKHPYSIGNHHHNHLSIKPIVGGKLPHKTPPGTSGNDVLIGTPHADVLSGKAGNDIINGLAGNDRLFGDAGNDALLGGEGNDTLSGGSGQDTILGGLGSDAINGGDDDDLLQDSGGNDLMDGGNGNDTIIGGPGSDTMVGGDGDDLFTSANIGTASTVSGGSGDDTLRVALNNIQNISITNDGAGRVTNTAPGTLSFSSIEILSTGIESDTFTFSSGKGHISVFSGDGNDRFHFAGNTLGAGIIIDGGEDDESTIAVDDDDATGLTITLTADDAGTIEENDGATLSFTSIATISGGAGEDSFSGSAFDDYFIGMAGNDSMVGGDGRDVLKGGEGDDTMIGGEGQDVYYVDSLDDVVIEDGVVSEDEMPNGDEPYGSGDSIDVVITTISYTLGDTLEALLAIDLFSYDFDFEAEHPSLTLVGNSGNNIIYSGLGDDIVSGLEGNDVIFCFGQDTISAGDGNDSIDLQSGIAYGWEQDGTTEVDGGDGEDDLRARSEETYLNLLFTANNAGTIESRDEEDEVHGTINFTSVESFLLHSGDDIINFQTFGNSTVNASTGDDTFSFSTGYGNGNSINGGLNDNESEDTIVIGSTFNQTVDLTDPDEGTIEETIADVTHSITFTEIESITTGSGDDVFIFSDTSLEMTVDGGAGNNTLDYSGLDELGINASIEDGEVLSGDTDNVILTFSGVNTLVGGGGSDTLTGGLENDRLYGGNGNDFIRFSGGDDTLFGGAGDDEYDTLDQFTGSSGSYFISDESGTDTLDFGSHSSDDMIFLQLVSTLIISPIDDEVSIRILNYFSGDDAGSGCIENLVLDDGDTTLDFSYVFSHLLR